jgi:cytochrome P450
VLAERQNNDAAVNAERPVPRTSQRGLLGDLPGFRRDALRTLTDAWRECGDLVRLRLGAIHAHLALHPDAVQHVLLGNAKNYNKQTRGFSKLKLALGEGLLTAEGSLWRGQRRVIQPMFHRERLQEFGTVMTDSTATMLERWAKRSELDEPIDIAEEMTALTLDIIGRTMFSAELGGNAKMLSDTVTLAARHINERITSFTGLFELSERLPTPKNRRFQAAIRSGDALIQQIVERRRKSGSGSDHRDLLSMLMSARDEETGAAMSDQQLRDEVVTIFSAGHETTALALTWTFYLLSMNPEAEERMREEVATLGGARPTLADLSRLGYAARVIKEAMRLFPPAWAISRRAEAEDHIGGYRIPGRAFVLLCPYLTHRHSSFWQNPDAFDPDRFLPERFKSQHRFAYLPFGAGARMCIGSNFAMMEAQLVLATIAQRFRLQLAPDHPVELEPLITLRSRKGMRMTATPQ